MNLWNFKPVYYHHLRRLWPFSMILEGENENIRSLLKNIEIRPRMTLDIGCGTGNAISLLWHQCVKLGVDNSLGMLQQLRLLQPGVIPVCADARFLPFKQVFDLILVVGLVEYFHNVNNLIPGIAKILRINGFLLFTTSSKKVINYLRSLQGNPVFPLSVNQVLATIDKTVFKTIDVRISYLQDQFLIQKIGRSDYVKGVGSGR